MNQLIHTFRFGWPPPPSIGFPQLLPLGMASNDPLADAQIGGVLGRPDTERLPVASAGQIGGGQMDVDQWRLGSAKQKKNLIGTPHRRHPPTGGLLRRRQGGLGGG
jgi:hypothetical protein